MYAEFFNLKEDPFNVTSDPEFFFSSSRHAEAFSHLVYGIQQRKGILVVTGEIGTGKTTLCRTFLSQVDTDVKTAFILNPYFSEKQLLQLILKDFGIEGNYKNKLGEVDIVAKDNETLCFIEVKTRTSLRFGYPQEAVTLSKQKQLNKVALSYLKQYNLFHIPSRFDIVSVLFNNQEKIQIGIIKNAFSL